MTFQIAILAASLAVLAAQVWHLRKSATNLTDQSRNLVQNKIDTFIADDVAAYVEKRVRAEVGKWAFSGGAGGRIAVYQYCVRCATRSASWSMIPDEGPICTMCIERS